jgi:peroxin-7
VVYTCSYDMTVGMWDWKAPSPLLNRWGHHSEFAVGLDASCLVEGLVASCGWDEMVHAWNAVDGSPPPVAAPPTMARAPQAYPPMATAAPAPVA